MSADPGEVTPPPDVTQGEEPQREDKSPAGKIEQRLSLMDRLRGASRFLRSFLNVKTPPKRNASMRSNRSMEPPTTSRDLQELDSLDPGPEPDFTTDYEGESPEFDTIVHAVIREPRTGNASRFLRSFLNVKTPPKRNASMRSNRSMEPPTTSRFGPTDPPPSSSEEESPESSLCDCISVNVESPKSRGALRRRISMEQPISFREEPDGVRWLRPEMKKYLCELVPDTDTMNKNLQLSDDGRTLTYEDDVQKYPDHPDRFDQRPQLLCRNALTGRCYWEVDWKGIINIAVSSRGIAREGDGEDCWFGRNDQSWSLYCSDRHGYTVSHKERPICSDGHFLAYHDNNPTTCSTTSSEDSNRAAVYVDVPAGTLSFFVVSGDELIHLHTFQTTFTDPLYPGFGFWGGSGGSVSLPSV